MLVIVPSTTIGNWEKEFETWAPQLSVVAMKGSKFSRDLIRTNEVVSDDPKSSRLKCHVLIASYEHTILDGSFYNKIEWEVMVCDEGHRLKVRDTFVC